MTELLSKEQLTQPSKRQYKTIDLPGGGSVRIRSWKSNEIRRFQTSLLDKKREQLVTKRSDFVKELTVAKSVVDESDELMFTEKEALQGCFDSMDGRVFSFLAKECREFSGLDLDDDYMAIEDEIGDEVKN